MSAVDSGVQSPKSRAMLVIILCILFGHASCLPSVSCFQDGQRCVVTDNLIDTVVSMTWEECSVICRVNQRCTAFSFQLGASSDQYNSCHLLSACEEREPCNDCVLGTEQEKCKCSVGYSRNPVDVNNTDTVQNVSDEMSCKRFCLEKEDCTHYTYFNSSDPDTPQTCLLMPSLGNGDLTRCEHCATGPSFCYTGQKCQTYILTDGDTNQYVFATSSRNATLIAKEKDCHMEVRALAVGGGGRGPTGYGGGAGSGHVNFTSLVLHAGNVLVLAVGAQGESSSVQMDGQMVLVASPGQNYDRNNGGDGYSGGGGYDGGVYGGDGGRGGLDGEDTSSGKGGHGSGLHIGELNMTRFHLYPGRGGNGSSTYGGGGAGGVVVNGQKPPGGTEFDGEGFGAGGFVGAKRFGCVLVEV